MGRMEVARTRCGLSLLLLLLLFMKIFWWKGGAWVDQWAGVACLTSLRHYKLIRMHRWCAHGTHVQLTRLPFAMVHFYKHKDIGQSTEPGPNLVRSFIVLCSRKKKILVFTIFYYKWFSKMSLKELYTE